ncbi:MAG: nicotinate phosphoribosyltransferase [Myxococcota bacterium]
MKTNVNVNPALLTDLYELTMAQAYVEEGLTDSAVFSLFVRKLPKRRNYLLACGLEDCLRYLETLRFDHASLEYLSTLGLFSTRFLHYLGDLRFSGDVYAVAEGTPVFANEPLLEVVAPLPQAQLVETFLMNQVHVQTLLASKAARVVWAARGRAVIDFGVRRMQGTDAGLKGARAFCIAGVDATSNVLAGATYGVAVAGTMAHSYVQCHVSELDSFRAFAHRYPATTLLVDTYDTLEGVQNVVRLARELGPSFQVRAVRLDSGDLLALSKQARRLLDDAGLAAVRIVASGGLDEEEIFRLLKNGAPIDAFGVGTAMGVSADAPSLDLAYKLVAYAGKGRTKLSPGKEIWPGQKQVFRQESGDVLGLIEEKLPGTPLLRQVMRAGARTPEGKDDWRAARARAEREIGRLPERLRALSAADPPYSVEVSERLHAERATVEVFVRQ